MKKAVFIEVRAVEDGGAPDFYAVANQPCTSPDGKANGLFRTDIYAVQRQHELVWKPGQILATDSLSLRSQQYYAMGPKLIALTDENGNLLPADKDADLKETQEAWLIFKNGDRPRKAGGPKTKLDMLKDDPKCKPPTIEDDGYYVDEELWYFILTCALNREPLMFVGDTGVGKTELAQYATKKLGVGLDIFDMAISNPMSALCGSLQITEAGHTEFVLARYAKSLMTPGVKLLDEISRAAPSANNVLMPQTDGRRTLYVEGNWKQPEIKMHEDAYIWSTANIGIQFTGTQEMDSALLNRFIPVDIAAPPRPEMLKVLKKRTDIDDKRAEKLLDFAEKVNTSELLSKGISPRQMLKVAKLVGDGFTLTKSLERLILPSFDGSSVDGGERGTVATLLQSL